MLKTLAFETPYGGQIPLSPHQKLTPFFELFFLIKKNNLMLAYRVVCCSYQSDCCIRVCFLHQQIATLGYVSHTNH